MTFLDSLRNYLSPQILVILCLGFISGVPYGVLMDPLNYWLSEEGIEKSTIGLLSLVFLIRSFSVFEGCFCGCSGIFFVFGGVFGRVSNGLLWCFGGI